MNTETFYIPYNKQKYLTTFKKELTLILPAQEAKSAGFLTKTLTQVGLNTNEVCEKFNKLTQNFPLGLLIPISIFYTPKEKNFEITFRPFQLNLILQQYIELLTAETPEMQNKYQITVLNLYKTLIIKSSIINEKNPKKYLRSILGTLKSYEFPVEINFTIIDFKQMLQKKIIQENQIPFLINFLILETEDLKEEEQELEEIDIIDFLLKKIKNKNDTK